MKPNLKFLATTIALGATTALLRAQDLVDDSVKEKGSALKETTQATVNNGGFFDELIASYSSWDLFKVGWLLATLVFAYGIATLFFKGMLGDRGATTAAKMGCFFGAIAFIGINLVTFGLLVDQMHQSKTDWVGWAAAIVLLVIVVLVSMSGKKVKA